MTGARETIVIQSYRPTDQPRWIASCLASARAWADGRGYAYRFLGDELFDALPPRFRMRTQHLPAMMADLGRLVAMRRALDEGFSRAMWLDADILVVDADALVVPDGAEVLCREVWVDRTAAGVVASHRINNCACAFARGSTLLPFYVDACTRVVDAASGTLQPLAIGTQLLTVVGSVVPLPAFETVATLSPHVVGELASAAGTGPALQALVQHARRPFAAANLCASFRNRTIAPPGSASWVLDDDVFEAAVARLRERPR